MTSYNIDGTSLVPEGYMANHLVEYSTDGGTIFVEVDLPTTAGDDRIPAGKPGQKIAEAAVTFEEALGSIKTVARSVVQQVKELSDPPDEVVVGFGIKLTGSANVVLASGSAEANLEVTLTWKSDKVTQA
jgi:hypothetical protein